MGFVAAEVPRKTSTLIQESFPLYFLHLWLKTQVSRKALHRFFFFFLPLQCA